MGDMKRIIYCLAALAVAAALLGAAVISENSKAAKKRYADAEKTLALRDFCDALADMERALSESDVDELNRAAGRAEAYLSRASLGDVGEAYKIIRLVASGECSESELKPLISAAKSALAGDELAFLPFEAKEKHEAFPTAETTEDQLLAQILERIGEGRDDVAFARATAFACPNAVFEALECTDGFYKYSGENIFVAVGGTGNRVLMYCFERELDPNYTVSREEAIKTAENVVKKEKLKLKGDPVIELCDGIYRSVWYKTDTAEPLLVLEVYSDTGRLRLYNACGYYADLS